MPRKPGNIKALPEKFERGFLQKLDGRTTLASVLKANYTETCDDLGGESQLSRLQRSLIERAIWLEARLQDIEYVLATAQPSNPDPKAQEMMEWVKLLDGLTAKWTQMINAYSGLCSKLGLQRQKKVADLKTYVTGNGNGTQP